MVVTRVILLTGTWAAYWSPYLIPRGSSGISVFDRPETAGCPLLNTHLVLVVNNWLFAICGQSTSFPTGSQMRLKCVNPLLSLFTQWFTRWAKYAPVITIHLHDSVQSPVQESQEQAVLYFLDSLFFGFVCKIHFLHIYILWKLEVIQLWVQGMHTQRAWCSLFKAMP